MGQKAHEQAGSGALRISSRSESPLKKCPSEVDLIPIKPERRAR